MSRHSPAHQFASLAIVVVSLAVAFSSGLSAKEQLPEVSDDGLQLQKDTKLRAVYLKAGAAFDQYQKFAILDCYVEFAKNWQRDYNENAVGLERRISAGDMDRIKTELAAEFKKVFTEELQTKGGYQVVDAAAPDVLVLRPAILNLRVTAPDTMSAGMTTTVVASAGQMTLYLELWDSVTSTILARVIDPEADQGMGGMAEVADSVTNKAAADHILKRWADTLRQHLDAVHGKAAGD